MIIKNSQMLKDLQEKGIKKVFPEKIRVTVGVGTCGTGNGADKIFDKLKELISNIRAPVDLIPVGCFGCCFEEPLVGIHIPGKPLVILNQVQLYNVNKIVDFIKHKEVPLDMALFKIEEWDFLDLPEKKDYGKDFPSLKKWKEIAFFARQEKIVLRHCGLINPDDIEEYIGIGGFSALDKTLHELTPEQVIEKVAKAKLRGRGGAGFPAATKWKFMRGAKSENGQKYIICNADEGDPGAYMNRNEMEGDPYMVLEGMIIGAYAMGATEGIIYCRAEYPLAVNRLRDAIIQLREYGLLGKKILGSNFNFNIEMVEGAGAFVCGEETALIASIENKSGRPRPRPPFPANKGLWGQPTNINNVETWCNIPVIINKGEEWFNSIGIPSCTGTKVFSLVGTVKNTGLVELPLGTGLDKMIFNIGGGSSSPRDIKAVQLGGPSGGCVPKELLATSVDYESLDEVGAIMGSGGVVVMDGFNCMCDIARYFITFTTSESCGKCVPCREGLPQVLIILNSICNGTAEINDLDILEELCYMIKDCSLCGLGQTAPNPVLTTLKYFRNEYNEHIIEHRCNAGVCQELFESNCANSCPLHVNIPGFIQLFKEDKIEEAFECILLDNPLPAITGRICRAHCNTKCRRADIDGAVSARELHRYIADYMYARRKEENIIKKLIIEKLPNTGKKIAIIGSGPAGLSAAFYLLRLGHSVDIYEKQAQAGGFLRYAIPSYRLPNNVLDHEIGFIEDLGANFLFNTEIGDKRSINSLKDKYDAIFIAIGAHQNVPLRCGGEDLDGVISGIDLLEQITNEVETGIGRKVIVIGGGNSAIDAARSALRFGADVTIAYRRHKWDAPAIAEEIEEAEKEGVNFLYMVSPENIIGQNGRVRAIELMKMKCGECDWTGRLKSLPDGETFKFPCDMVIKAIGERVKIDFIKDSGIEIKQRQKVAINPLSHQTNVPKVFAGGDFVTGPSTCAEAMEGGKNAAKGIHLFLTGKENFNKLFKKFYYKDEVLDEPESGNKNIPRELLLEERIQNFNEVVQTYSRGQAIVEASRCLRCDVKKGADKK